MIAYKKAGIPSFLDATVYEQCSSLYTAAFEHLSRFPDAKRGGIGADIPALLNEVWKKLLAR